MTITVINIDQPARLIYDVKSKNYIKVKDFKDATVNPQLKSDALACLITSNHTIPIGRRLFHDWEDNQH